MRRKNMLILHILLQFICIKTVHMTLASMSGTEYITYDISKQKATETRIRKATETRITFRFKTINPTGLFLFSENYLYGDYISLEIIDGKLRYKANLGLGKLSEQEMIVGSNLNTYEWHVVDIKRTANNISISLDYHTLFKTFKGEFSRLDLNQKVYFGGVSDKTDVSPYKITNRKYAGCLRDFLFNDIDILYKAKFNKQRFSVQGDILWGQCEELYYLPVMFQHPHDHALVPTYIKNSLSISFKFRTHIGEGLLMAKISKKVTVYMGLREGVILLNVRIKGPGPIIMTKGSKLNDGFWHRVEILVNKEIIKLKLDKFAETTHKSPWSQLIEFHKSNATLGGGEEQLMQGFVGCMYDIWVDNTPIDYGKLSKEYRVGVLKKCELEDKCLFSPCKHGGACSQDYLKFSCDCLNTMYSGPTCEESIYQPSCQEYKDLGLNEDSYCFIDPDGYGKIRPFEVLCNMTKHKKDAVTIFEHNINKGQVLVSTGAITDNLYHHSLKYKINIETFDTVLQKAVQCKQYIQFRCKNAFLMRSPQGPPDTIWVGRNGNYEEYWGGAEPDSGKCKCGTDKSCAQRYIYCNCDTGDDVWREDSGFFTQTDRLPVLTLTFQPSANQSFFTVGNLECEFNSSTLPVVVNKQRVLKACRPVNEIPTTRPYMTPPTHKRKGIVRNWRRIIKIGKLPTVKIHIEKSVIPINVNVTVELPKIDVKENSKKEDNGLKFTLSVYAVIVITVATVIVVIIIAVLIVGKRCQRRNQQRPRRTDYDSEDDYEPQNESTVMCHFFGSVARSERNNRPVIEVHRHSIHCDTIDELPPAYRDVDNFTYPITTHIDLSYKSRKKSLGIFC